MTCPAPSQVVIGVDAMEWSLVRRWAQDGRLPTFAHLLASGTHAELDSPAEDLPDTSWASLYTGRNPAHQERYFHLQFDAATRRLRCLADDVLRGEPFWSVLSREGQRVAVMDAPKYPLTRSLRGLQLVNWGSHATHTARSSEPAALLREIEHKFGPFPLRACDAIGHRPRALKKLRRQVLAGVAAHGVLFRWALRESPCDVFFGVFSGPHCIAHHTWHGLEADHPRHREAVEHGLADSVESAYRAVDREIGEILALLHRDTRVLVCTPEGMGPLCHGSWVLQQILDDMGHGPVGHRRPFAARSAARNPFRTLRAALPGNLQFGLLERLPAPLHDRLLSVLYTRGRGWQQRRAFTVPNNDGVGAIRINVRGREPDGLVEPGAEYRERCDRIAADLLALRDCHTGRPVVARVGQPQQRYRGPYRDRLPDLTVAWEQGFRWSAVEARALGRMAVPTQDTRSGSHRPRGFLIAAGPGIASGVELSGASVFDIAPTIVAAAGVALPDDRDGRPLPLTRVAGEGTGRPAPAPGGSTVSGTFADPMRRVTAGGPW